MSAAGLGRLARSATRIVAKPANGFHLVRIDGYSQTKRLLPGRKLSSNSFAVGGYSWRVDYYPNGRDVSANHKAISVYLQLAGNHYQQQFLEARYKFSLLDHGGKAAYELPAENGSFVSIPVDNNYAHQYAVGTFGRGEEKPGCGHEEFILKEELEKREHLIRDDNVVLRCDVGVTEVGNEWLAHDELNAWEDGEESEEEGFEAPGMTYGAPRRRQRRKRRANDNEYIKWCLAQRFR
jgi:speckle-type POZ protein